MAARMGAARRVAVAVVALATAGVGLALGTGTSQAVSTPQDVVVSDNPVNHTPHVLDGQVNAIAQIGDTIYLGGKFTRVREDDSTTEVPRSNVVAFDARTGDLRPWAPAVNGEVNAIVAAPDGRSVYLGGTFTAVGGSPIARLARLDAITGVPVAGFTTPTINGAVKDLRVVGGRLWLGGAFTHVGGVPQAALATIDAATGARDRFMSLAFAGVHNGGVTGITKFDVTADGRSLVAIGNFRTVDGKSRRQAVMLDIGGAAATVADWQTDFYSSECSGSFQSYLRDLDISPDGSYVVITTTGAYAGGPPKSCDTQARFEMGARGTGLTPTWVNYTGGDTSYAVAVTGTAVYVGGHFRWANNPHSGDRAGRGAVAREGIAALDPANGLPLSWNPGRTKGVGVFDMLATPDGLWVASDTDRIGNWEYHGRIAFFPVAGGTAMPANFTGQLPGTVYLLGRPSGAGASDVKARSYDGTTAGGAVAVDRGGVDWSRARGAVMIDHTLYTGWSDGQLYARSFDGRRFGPATRVDAADQLVVDTPWHTDLANVTSLFFEGGRLYYTVSGSSSLYYRWFTPASGVVGAQRFTASNGVPGLSFSTARGAFLADGQLYVAGSDGALRRVAFTGGQPVGAVSVVSGPTVDGADWSARGLFLHAGEPVIPNQPPTAAFDVSCTHLSCTVDASASSDAEGPLAGYEWDFGDGTGDVGLAAQHAYAEAGTYTISLSVTDGAGATSQTTATVEVTAPPANSAPTAAFTASCDGLACTFDASGSSDPDGPIAAYDWDFGDGGAGSGAAAQHTYGAQGVFTVGLTVTDAAGTTAHTTRDVAVAPVTQEPPPAAAIQHVASASTSANTTRHRVTVPSGVQPGDGLLLFVSSNTPTAVLSDPTGAASWQELGSAATGSLLTRVYRASAQPGSAGAIVEVTTSLTAKVNVTVAAYRGTAVDPVAAWAAAPEMASATGHTTPTVPVAGSAWVVSYWAHKDSASTSLTSTGVTDRSAVAGTGGGRVVSLLADSGGPVTGTAGGAVATAEGASAHATMWTIVLGGA